MAEHETTKLADILLGGGPRRDVESWGQTATFEPDGVEHRVVLECGHGLEFFETGEEIRDRPDTGGGIISATLPCPACDPKEVVEV